MTKPLLLLCLLPLLAPMDLIAQERPASGSEASASSNKPNNTPASRWTSLRERATSSPPDEWATTPPDAATVEAWKQKESERIYNLSREAGDFYTLFPKDLNADSAKQMEMELCAFAAELGSASAAKKLDSLLSARLKSPDITPAEKLQIRSSQVLRNARTAEELETGARELIKEFPDEPALYQVLLMSLLSAEPDHARATASEIAKSDAPPAAKKQAADILKRLDMIGQPFEMEFTAVDGRKVSMEDLKGKTVLVNFWASWCGPCMAHMPELKTIYAVYKDKGVEVIGINLDRDKDAMDRVVKGLDLPWPQAFDGKEFDGALPRSKFVTALPTLMLVDKNGILRDINARNDLAQKLDSLVTTENQ